MRTMKLAPSVFGAGIGNLSQQLKILEENNVELLHVDVMDGHFVEKMAFGPDHIKMLKELTTIPLDVHLMIVNPEKFIKEVKDLGTMMMNVHYEACVHLHRVVQQIKDAGMKAAVTLNPSTPVAMLVDIIRDVDMVLLMSVNPGFGGQKFIVHTLDKVRELRELITHTGSRALIEVDGGVNLETGRQLVEAGADVLVAGNAVFKAPDMSDMIHRLKSL